MLSETLGRWRRDGATLSTALTTAIREAIVDGRIRPGDALPAERRMATELRVSRGTVATVLTRLRADGWIDTRHGSASRVKLPAGLGERYAPTNIDADRSVIDLRHAMPAAPREAYTNAVNRAASRATRLLLGDGQPGRGLPELREQVAQRYTREGLPTRPEQILITSGARAGLALLLTHLSPHRVAVENPSYFDTLAVLRRFGARLFPVSVSSHGWDQQHLESAFASAAGGAALLVPDFQNPTGALMSHEQRRRVANLARRHRVTVITDETMRDIDLRDAAEPMPRVDGAIVIGSLGKTVWGGLRIGWLRAPARLIGALLMDPLCGPYTPPPMEQLVAHELLGETDTLLSRRRDELRSQRDHLVECVGAQGHWSFQVPEGGLGLWMRSPRVSSERLASHAQQHGLALFPGTRFSPDRTLEPWLRLPYTLPRQRLTEAAQRMDALMADLAVLLVRRCWRPDTVHDEVEAAQRRVASGHFAQHRQ